MHPAGIAILIVTTWVTLSVPLGLLVGRFIRAGQAGGPPVVAPPPETTPHQHQHQHHPDASVGADGVLTAEPVGTTPPPTPTTGPRSRPSLRNTQPGRLLIRRVRTVTGMAGHRRPAGHTPTTPPTTPSRDRRHAADSPTVTSTPRIGSPPSSAISYGSTPAR